MVIKMLTELGSWKDETGENFNNQSNNIRKYQTEFTELKDIITELKKIFCDILSDYVDNKEIAVTASLRDR